MNRGDVTHPVLIASSEAGQDGRFGGGGPQPHASPAHAAVCARAGSLLQGTWRSLILLPARSGSL
jgi:hypothetical protein